MELFCENFQLYMCGVAKVVLFILKMPNSSIGKRITAITVITNRTEYPWHIAAFHCFVMFCGFVILLGTVYTQHQPYKYTRFVEVEIPETHFLKTP
jgi:hypothetical protein